MTKVQKEKAEKIRELERDIKSLEHVSETGSPYMNSIEYWEGLNDKAQEGLEAMEKIYLPLKLHAEHMSKKLRDYKQELKSKKFVLDLILNPCVKEEK